MSRPYYAPTSHYWDGRQSAYDAGLSYFPDTAVPMPLGDWMSDLAMVGGGAVGGPGGAATAGAAASVIQHWFGGSAVDQTRQDRVNYFAGLAANGNVAAAQLILGGPDNVSGNERQMWVNAANALNAAAPGVMAEAHAAGPLWLQNSGDSAATYPAMRRVTAAWAAQHPVTTVTGTVGGAISDFFNPAPPPQGTYPASSGAGIPVNVRASVSPALLLGVAAVGAAVLFSKRRRRS